MHTFIQCFNNPPYKLMYTKCLNDLLPLKLTRHIILKQVLTSSLCSSSELPLLQPVYDHL